MKKTIFLDIDGCILKHHGGLTTIATEHPELLPGVLEKFDDWDKEGHRIILTTGRKESMRKMTEIQLRDLGIFYDTLVMGCNRGERVVINDFKPNSTAPTARAVCIERNKGLKEVTI